MYLLALLLLGCQETPEPSILQSQSCSAGNAQACFELGRKQVGSARPDYTAARRMFSTGCSTHHAEACNALGALVRDARGGPKDLVRAADLFKVACDKGVAQGCVHLADALHKGDGVSADPDQAMDLYRQSCSGDPAIPRACTQLALGLRDKRGARRSDREEAEALLIQACDAEYPAACVELANDLTKKWGRDNMQRAAQLYDDACSIDANFGCYELAELHIKRKAPDSTALQAGHYYQQVCRLDSSRGCYELAELMTTEKIPSRPGEKEALYKLACESGLSEACAKR